MIEHDVCGDRFPLSKATTQSHNKYHNSARFAQVSEVVNKTTSTNTIMMIPDILRNLFDIDYLPCPSVLTTTNATTRAELVSTINKNVESTSSIPAQQISNEAFIHTSTTSTTAPTLLNDHSSIIIKPSMHCTPRTIETTMSTDDDNDDDDDYDTSEAEHRNVTTTPSNTNRTSFNDSPSAPSPTLLMTVTPSPDSAIQIGVNPTTNSENHAYDGRSAIGGVNSPIPISFLNQDITRPVLPIDGNRRSIATRLLFFPIQHRKLQRTTSVASSTSPVDTSKPIDSKVERRRRLLRREKHHRKATTVDVKETPTSTTQMGSQRSTVNEVMLDDTENTDITTTMDDDSIRMISKLRQQLQSMDRQLQSITVLNDSNIDRLSPNNNDSNDSTQSNLGIVFNQHLESIQHLLTRMQQDMTTSMNPIATNEYEADAISVERALVTTSSTTPSIVVNDNISPPTPSYNMNNFFIRVQDLDIECLPHDVSISSSLSSLSTISTSFHKSSSPLNYDNKFYFHVTSPSKLGMILERLVQYGYRTISQPNDKNDSVDNIDFQPIRDTQRLLQQQQKHGVSLDDELNRCHIYTWIGTKDKNHTCSTDIVDTFGNTWPIAKVRAIIPNATPLQLITFLFDSTQVPKYNNISLGRDDLMTWHYDQNYENSASSSNNDSLIGTVKIVRGRVQPKLFPKVIETLCIMYITSIPGELDSYMIVSRSILEDETWGDENAAMILTSPNSNNSTQSATATIRSEMLLNVYYVRPMKQQGHCCSHSVDGTRCCELTMVTHVVSPGVPEIFAKRMAPTTATTMVREIQSIFSAK